MSNLAERKNEGKLRWRNFPLFLMRPLARVGMFGEGKYETYNFLKGGSFNQYYDCAMRHLDKYTDPDLPDLDAESGESHLSHVAWNLLVAIYMAEKFPDLDDRYKTEKELVSLVYDIAGMDEKLRDFLLKKKVMKKFLANNPSKRAVSISSAFYWTDTPEGRDFWSELHEEFLDGE